MTKLFNKILNLGIFATLAIFVAFVSFVLINGEGNLQKVYANAQCETEGFDGFVSTTKLIETNQVAEKEKLTDFLDLLPYDASTVSDFYLLINFITYTGDTTNVFDADYKQKIMSYFNDDTANNSVFSVHEYFYAQSQGRLNVWALCMDYESPNSKDYYDSLTASGPQSVDEQFNREEKIFNDALNANSGDLSFLKNKQGQTVTGIYGRLNYFAGSATVHASSFWPKNWSYDYKSTRTSESAGLIMYTQYVSGQDIGVGVFCHELTHLLNISDYYTNTSIVPVGGWDLMGSTNYANPQTLSPYFREKIGWFDESHVYDKNSTQIENITSSGTYTINDSSSQNGVLAYKFGVRNGINTEYFMVEFKYKNYTSTPTDYYTLGTGLLIYRVNEYYDYKGNYGQTDQSTCGLYMFRNGNSSTNYGACLIVDADSTSSNLKQFGSTLSSATPTSNTIFYSDLTNSQIVIKNLHYSSNGGNPTMTFDIELPNELYSSSGVVKVDGVATENVEVYVNNVYSGVRTDEDGYFFVTNLSDGAVITFQKNGKKYDEYLTITKDLPNQNINIVTVYYDIVASASEHGTISNVGTKSIEKGGNIKYTFTPDEGYHVSKILIDGIELLKQKFVDSSNDGYEFKNVIINHTISVEFAINGLFISSSSNDLGTIVVLAPKYYVNAGDDVCYTFVANQGCYLKNVYIDGEALDDNELADAIINGYTFENVNTNHTIEAEFEIQKYEIQISATNQGATVSPTGTQIVNYGTNLSVSIALQSGYFIERLVIDGTVIENEALLNQIAVSGYTFENVKENHTFVITFKIYVFHITILPSQNGAIMELDEDGYYVVGDTTTHNYGEEILFQAVGEQGYVLSKLELIKYNYKGEYVSKSLVPQATIDEIIKNQNIFRINSIKYSYEIQGYFTSPTYTITSSCGPNGSITPSGETSVSYGSEQMYYFEPENGYRVKSIYINNTALTGEELVNAVKNSCYTFKNISSNNSIVVYFSVAIYNFTFISNTSQCKMALSSGKTTVEHNQSATVLFTLDEKYFLKNLFVNGEQIEQEDFDEILNFGYYISNVVCDYEIEAEFEKYSYAIYVYDCEGGSVLLNVYTPCVFSEEIDNGTKYTFYIGETAIFNIVGMANYKITRLNIDEKGKVAGDLSTYVFEDIQIDHTFSASFKLNADIAYTVRHYKQSLSAQMCDYIEDGKCYTLFSEEVLKGTADSVTTAQSKSGVVGFAPLEIKQQVINIDETTVVNVLYDRLSYNVVIETGEGIENTIGAGLYFYGESVKVVAITQVGYTFSKWEKEGLAQEFFTAEINFIMPSNDVALKPISNAVIFHINASAGDNGSITPNGVVDAGFGKSKCFEFVANTGYVISNVIIDENSVGCVTSYTFININANHTIYVEFAQQMLGINLPTSSSKGSIVCVGGSTDVRYGESKTFKVQPTKGYEIDKVIVNGISVNCVDNIFTVKNITNDLNISVEFKEVAPITLSTKDILLILAGIAILLLLILLLTFKMKNNKRNGRLKAKRIDSLVDYDVEENFEQQRAKKHEKRSLKSEKNPTKQHSFNPDVSKREFPKQEMPVVENKPTTRPILSKPLPPKPKK